MKKFFSNKNKMMVSSIGMNLSKIIGMLLCVLILEIQPLISIASIVIGCMISGLINDKYYEKYKSNYCNEVSKRYILEKKDNIRINDKKNDANILHRFITKVKLTEFVIWIILGIIIFSMFIMSIPGFSFVLGISYIFEILKDIITEKLDISLTVINNVINLIETRQLDANPNNVTNELGKNNTPSNQLSNRYVPGVSPTITEIVNNYTGKKNRKGPVRARRIDDNRR